MKSFVVQGFRVPLSIVHTTVTRVVVQFCGNVSYQGIASAVPSAPREVDGFIAAESCQSNLPATEADVLEPSWHA
ncbi:MAG TPA: hypothetical protein VNO32_52420 [Candidatus Acidoferrum sp.]|nr:hypothetical protein [Candidatus Acidoferrum sp.]